MRTPIFPNEEINFFDIFNEDDDEDGEPKHPLQLLAKAAALMNPKQMELTKDMACPVQLPGQLFSGIKTVQF